MLKQELHDLAFANGADAFGIADLTSAKAFVEKAYGDKFACYPRAVSFAIYLPYDILNELEDGPSRSYQYVYHVINQKMDEIALLVALRIQKEHYKAYPVPASQYRFDPSIKFELKGPKMQTELKGAFSHRLAARLAGIGWIGKSNHVISPEVGPRLRLCTVLTDAPLEADSPIENRCGKCTRCRDACPVHAIKGVTFEPDIPLEERFDRDKCHDYFDLIRETAGVDNCGKCILACPWGKKYVK